ncbi:magnesium transporter [uncultured Rothia sp.]|uniref:magnesium transporter n=1 Tax=uncultured Rothia sp. TaxID=316088 RepID=UPI0028DD308C|nr:magnesium transporter [uncultured Rothia sp.]
MAEHSEAPKNPQNPTEKSSHAYQPLWDMEQPAPDYSALLLHGTPVPAPTGEIPEPVKEVLEIQKARSASVPADTVAPAPTAPDSAAPALSVSAPAPSAQAANFFPSATGHPVLNRPLYGRPGPTMRRMSPMGTDAGASAHRQVPTAFPAWMDEKVVGTPRPIGYISATPLAGKVRGSDLWKKAWPELIALFFVGVVFNPLTYLLLATVTGDPQIGGYVFYYFLMLSLLTMGLPMFLWGGALFFALVRVSRKYRALKWEAMPLGSFWFYLVYDRLPRDAEEMQRILGTASSMSSAAALTSQPPSAPSPTSTPVPNSADAS